MNLFINLFCLLSWTAGVSSSCTPQCRSSSSPCFCVMSFTNTTFQLYYILLMEEADFPTHFIPLSSVSESSRAKRRSSVFLCTSLASALDVWPRSKPVLHFCIVCSYPGPVVLAPRQLVSCWTSEPCQASCASFQLEIFHRFRTRKTPEIRHNASLQCWFHSTSYKNTNTQWWTNTISLIFLGVLYQHGSVDGLLGVALTAVVLVILNLVQSKLNLIT